MFKLFLFQLKDGDNRPPSKVLAEQCAKIYMGLGEAAKLVYDEKGKPFFTEGCSDIHLSISHSGKLWSAVLGNENCGLDIQEIRECDFERLADRFFTQAESMYVKNGGLKAYFQLWARREALGKLTGEGFFMKDRPELVDGSGRVCSAVKMKGKDISFYDIDMDAYSDCDMNYEAVWCCENAEGQLEVVIIDEQSV